MLDNIKNILTYKSVDILISEKKYDLALEKLNTLIKDEFKLSETFLKRGKLCHKLLMYDDAYSDYTYIINHCANKTKAYMERVFLNFDIENYKEAISDAEKILALDESNINVTRVKILSLIFLELHEEAQKYLLSLYNNKYKALQHLFNETAQYIARNELSKSLSILKTIDKIDFDNPFKLFNEAEIYRLAGDNEKYNNIISRLNAVFQKYFISHFRFTDMYQEKDLWEISFLLELSVFDKENLFIYPRKILEGYKNYLEGHIADSKENFQTAVSINPEKAEGYVLLAQTLQLMSGYDNPQYKKDAEINYIKAMEIYARDNRNDKVEDMRKQIKHLNSTLTLM